MDKKYTWLKVVGLGSSAAVPYSANIEKWEKSSLERNASSHVTPYSSTFLDKPFGTVPRVRRIA
jgi:hypothetical protein